MYTARNKNAGDEFFDNNSRRLIHIDFRFIKMPKRSSDTAVQATESTSGTMPLTTSRLKLRIKRFHAVARWSWNVNDEVCGICQTAFEGTSPNVKYPGEDCPVVFGKCAHAFHLQCVSTWLSTSASSNKQQSCPICRQEWVFGENPVNRDSNNNSSE